MGGPLMILSPSSSAAFSATVTGSAPPVPFLSFDWASMGMSLSSSQIFCWSRSMTRRRSRDVAVARV